VSPRIAVPSRTPGRPPGSAWADNVWERKFELDSFGAFMRLSAGYYEATGDTTPFNENWQKALGAIMEVMRLEQTPLNTVTLSSVFKFVDANGGLHPALRMEGYGYPGQGSGLVRTLFRPSDDETVFPYHIPANAMAVVGLRNVATILRDTQREDFAHDLEKLADTIDSAITRIGIVKAQVPGAVFAYEVDGFGSSCLMDDPNVPSLLSLPYLGYCSTDNPTYKATRKFALTSYNPFFATGTAASGLTSPHAGALNQFWPIATVMQALTSTDESEITQCLRILSTTHAGTYFMHESINVNDPAHFTRPWFGWANSLFGELILQISQQHPTVLSQTLK
jgi:meiotically up-regulated gene 157 (Mug157) protein